MKQTKKALICALVGAIISTPAFACDFKQDVEGRYKVVPQAVINGEQCKTSVGDKRLEIDVDCPSEQGILTVWLFLPTKEQFLRTGDYVSRLLCPTDWKPSDNASTEKFRYDAIQAELAEMELEHEAEKAGEL